MLVDFCECYRLAWRLEIRRDTEGGELGLEEEGRCKVLGGRHPEEGRNNTVMRYWAHNDGNRPVY